MIINIPIAINNTIHQLTAEREYYLFSVRVHNRSFANKVIYRISLPEGIEVTDSLSKRIQSQHGKFLEQFSNGKEWTIKYTISGE